MAAPSGPCVLMMSAQQCMVDLYVPGGADMMCVRALVTGEVVSDTANPVAIDAVNCT